MNWLKNQIIPDQDHNFMNAVLKFSNTSYNGKNNQKTRRILNFSYAKICTLYTKVIIHSIIHNICYVVHSHYISFVSQFVSHCIQKHNSHNTTTYCTWRNKKLCSQYSREVKRNAARQLHTVDVPQHSNCDNTIQTSHQKTILQAV